MTKKDQIKGDNIYETPSENIKLKPDNVNVTKTASNNQTSNDISKENVNGEDSLIPKTRLESNNINSSQQNSTSNNKQSIIGLNIYDDSSVKKKELIAENVNSEVNSIKKEKLNLNVYDIPKVQSNTVISGENINSGVTLKSETEIAKDLSS